VKEDVLAVLQAHPCKRESLIPVLQEIQAKFSYLPEEAILLVSDYLKITPNDIYGVASFYAQFRFQRQGEHSIKICQGTACHVKGGRRILTETMQQLGIGPGQTTPDFKFSIETVACFGACALAPVMVVDKDVYGRMKTPRVKKILSEY